MKIKHEFNQSDIQAFEPENKIGILATVNEQNQAHITMITTLQARNSKELVWGQFSEGISKVNITDFNICFSRSSTCKGNISNKSTHIGRCTQ